MSDKLSKNCIQCGKLFFKSGTISMNWWNNVRKYCSRPCQADARKVDNYYQFECLFCGVSSKAPGYTPDRKYCSTGCYKAYMKANGSVLRSRVTKSCEQCSIKYEVKFYRREESKYCSMSCKILAQDNGISTENEKQRKSVSAKMWRKRVFERDDYTCQLCGTKGGVLNADHIKPFAYFPHLRFELSNGRTLCEGCHRETDTWGHRASKLYSGSRFEDVLAVTKVSK